MKVIIPINLSLNNVYCKAKCWFKLVEMESMFSSRIKLQRCFCPSQVLLIFHLVRKIGRQLAQLNILYRILTSKSLIPQGFVGCETIHCNSSGQTRIIGDLLVAEILPDVDTCLIKLCSHLVPEHWCLGPRTKTCCV